MKNVKRARKMAAWEVEAMKEKLCAFSLAHVRA